MGDVKRPVGDGGKRKRCVCETAVCGWTKQKTQEGRYSSFCQSCTSNADVGEGVSLTGNGECI